MRSEMSAIHAGTKKWGQIIGSHSKTPSTCGNNDNSSQVFRTKHVSLVFMMTSFAHFCHKSHTFNLVFISLILILAAFDNH